MATLLLIRHGRTTANAEGVLAGHTPGVGLDETGRKQATALAARLAEVPLTVIVTSPLQRCVETAQAVLAGRAPDPGADTRPRATGRRTAQEPAELRIEADERLVECRYGDWTGAALRTLAKDPMWRVVQTQPSAARFPGPGGETLRAVQARAVDAVREWDARVERIAGPGAVWAAVSHGDVIKAIVADALGLHLDQFQRIAADPASVSVLRYTPQRPFVVRLNTTGGDLALGRPAPRRRARGGGTPGDAPVGGGLGAADVMTS